jgi:hypothetical protein
MPALLIVVAVAGIYFLLKPTGQNVAVVQTTPGNGGVGITTGFAPPAVESGVSSPINSVSQKNQPSTSGSGVPDFSSQSQEFNSGPSTLLPSPGFTSFYHPSQAGLLGPVASVAMKPASEGGGGCGCGGGCQKKGSDCGNQKRRINDSGCLAPSRAKQIQNTPPVVFHSWARNIEGAGYDMEDAVNQHLYERQLDNPPNAYENFIPPTAPVTTSIGMPPNGF